ncbi:uncharacterized protein PG986_003905 [Apiospora aurea]|uniref:Uncharacterized protein n=1 Tax=Apiospora aurea TaxID=335848 RepID=A0ABR1QLE6_9PEZI
MCKFKNEKMDETFDDGTERMPGSISPSSVSARSSRVARVEVGNEGVDQAGNLDDGGLKRH